MIFNNMIFNKFQDQWKHSINLSIWLAKEHPDVLIELIKMKKDYPEDWNIVDRCDDNYEDLYHYYCEWT